MRVEVQEGETAIPKALRDSALFQSMSMNAVRNVMTYRYTAEMRFQ